MKLYPFLRAKSYESSCQQCFLSILNYHGYMMDKNYLNHVFQQNDNGVTFSHLLEGLDYFSVVYEKVGLDAFDLKDVSGMILKTKNGFQLCCGRLFGKYLFMCPVRGYRLLSIDELKEEGVLSCVKINFLGEFSYTHITQQQILSYAKDLVFSILAIVFCFIPILHDFLSYIFLIIFTVVLLKQYATYVFDKKKGQFQDFPEVLAEWDTLIKVSTTKHLYFILLLQTMLFIMCDFRQGGAMIVFLILLFLLRLKYSSAIFVFCLTFAFLGLAHLYVYLKLPISLHFVIGMSLSFLSFILFEKYMGLIHQEKDI